MQEQLLEQLQYCLEQKSCLDMTDALQSSLPCHSAAAAAESET